MPISGNYENGRLKFDGFNDVPSDRGINKHNRFSKWFRRTIKFDFFDNNTNQNKTTYLNRKSAIKWLQSNKVKVDTSASNGMIRNLIIDQIKKHQAAIRPSEASNQSIEILTQDKGEVQSKLANAFSLKDDNLKINYRNIECEFQKSSNSPDLIVLTKNLDEKKLKGSVGIGKIFKLTLENDDIQIKEIGVANESLITSVKLQEASPEKIAELIAKHSHLEIDSLSRQLGLKPESSNQEKFTEMELEFTSGVNPDQVEVKITGNAITEQYFLLILENDDHIHIKRVNIENGEAITEKTIPSKDIKSLSNELYILAYNDLSNKGILWKKLITHDKKPFPKFVLAGDDNTLMRFKLSTIDDCVEIFKGLPARIAFKMFLDGDKVIIKDASKEQSPVLEFPIENMGGPDRIFRLLTSQNPNDVEQLKDTEEPQWKIDNSPKATSRFRRMLGSIYWDKDGILMKINEFGLQPSDKTISAFSADKVNILFDYFGVSEFDKSRFINRNLTVFELAEEIIKLNSEGLDVWEKKKGMEAVLKDFLNSQEVSEEDKNFFKIFQQRIAEQNDLYFSEIQHLRFFPDEKSKIEGAQRIAQYILLKIDHSKYRDIGFFVDGGWQGHHINVEVRKIGERFHFYIANAGAGVSYHNQIDFETNRGRTIKIFEANAEDALEILKEVIHLNESDIKNGAEKFYNIFDKAKNLDDSRIPTRPLQSGGNCGIRNQEECLFYACQREGRVEAANNFLKSIQRMLGKEDSEQFFKEKLHEKESIQPLMDV